MRRAQPRSCQAGRLPDCGPSGINSERKSGAVLREYSEAAGPAILERMHAKYSEPGIESDLDLSVDIWKKGIVFTSRTPSSGIDAGYRISVAFKRSVSTVHPLVGFRDLYGRVNAIGAERVSGLVSANQHLSHTATIVCHG